MQYIVYVQMLINVYIILNTWGSYIIITGDENE